MFAHLSPEGDSFGETISTLKFAQRVSTIELGAVRANKESGEIMQLKDQVNLNFIYLDFRICFWSNFPCYKSCKRWASKSPL
jgi:hypothetical protein